MEVAPAVEDIGLAELRNEEEGFEEEEDDEDEVEEGRGGEAEHELIVLRCCGRSVWRRRRRVGSHDCTAPV